MGHKIDILDLLAVKHKDWINICRSFGATKELAEDVTQDMYIKLHIWSQKNDRSLMYNKSEVNYYFVFKALRSIYIDTCIKEAITFNPEDDSIFINKSNEEELEHQDMYLEIEEKLRNMYWYDRKIFELVFVKKISMLQLSKMTGISYYSIKRTVQKVKKLIK